MYTEQQLKNAIKFACQEQKFRDYQFAGECLIVYDAEVKQGIENLLNSLVDIDNIASINIQDAIKD